MRFVLVSVNCGHHAWLQSPSAHGYAGEKHADCLNCSLLRLSESVAVLSTLEDL